MTSPTSLKDYFETKGITTILPSSSEFSTLSKWYHLSDPKVPLAVIRPKTAEEVSVIVKYATENGIKIVIRSGGGDLFGRSQVEGTLTIDMRQLNYVRPNSSNSTACVGGGCTVGDVAAGLAESKLITPVPPIAAVGYVGWATLGGYGPFASNFGLGIDQIVGAKVVNWKGGIVDADEEMLKGIRGAGGNFGIIVELTIKVYSVGKVLAGMILFESSDIHSTFVNYSSAYREFLKTGKPQPLGIQPAVVNTEHGRMLGVMFVWSSSDLETGRAYLEKIASLGKEVMRAVQEMTVREWQETLTPFAPFGTYGHAMSVSVATITDEIAQVIGRNAEKMPKDQATSFSWHELSGISTKPDPNSVFLVRQPHYILELLGVVIDQANVEASETWMQSFRKELLECDGVLESPYISLTRPSHATLQTLYGSNVGLLHQLKDKYDPNGIFDLAVPRLRDSK